MSLNQRAKEIAKVTVNKSLVTVNLTTKLAQVTNYAEWRTSLCKAETLIDSELQSALSSDTSMLATFRHLHDEIRHDQGKLPSRSARLLRVQTELQNEYLAAISLSSDTGDPKWDAPDSEDDDIHTPIKHGALRSTASTSSTMKLGRRRVSEPVERRWGSDDSEEDIDPRNRASTNRRVAVRLPKRAHEISTEEAFELFNAVEARDEAEIERFRKDLHYLTFTGELETREAARLRKVFFEDIMTSMEALTIQFRRQIPYGNIYFAWRSVERKAMEINTGAVMERYATNMAKLRLETTEEVIDFAERFKSFYEESRAHGFKRSPEEWRNTLLRALENNDTPIVEHILLEEVMHPHETDFETVAFLQYIIEGCTGSLHGPGRRRHVECDTSDLPPQYPKSMTLNVHEKDDKGGRGRGNGKGRGRGDGKGRGRGDGKNLHLGDGTKDPSRRECWDWNSGKCERTICGFYHNPLKMTSSTLTPAVANIDKSLKTEPQKPLSIINGDKRNKAMMIVKMLQAQDEESVMFIREQMDLNL